MSPYPFRLLHVNLTTGEFEREEIPSELVRQYLGGPSLAARLMYPSLLSDLDPLSPEAPLAFMTGALTGTSGPAVSRSALCARSPATRLWGESNIGSFIGAELRSAGVDGLVLTGRASNPVYLWLRDGQAALRPATQLWGGCDTYETQERIRAEVGVPLTRVAAIGLAGESQLPFALVLCDHGRVAGRTGMGAVMGSKNLKAIAVRGTRPIPIVASEAFGRARRLANVELRNDNVTRAMREYGTSANTDYFDYLGELPKHYFSRGVFEGTTRASGVTMAETVLKGVGACHACVIACGRRVDLGDGTVRKGPEYETLVGFGPNLEIADIPTITRLGELCDRYGLDTISTSNVIGLAFLLFEEGLLSERDADGEKLVWGEAAVVERLIHRLARREGLGALLAQGARALAEHFGVPELAAQVKGLEVAYHDPRSVSGMALVYATSPRGACHNQGDYFMVDAMGQTTEEIGVTLHERQAGAVKAASVARHQDWRTASTAAGLCHFANVAPETVVELLNLVTGFDCTLEEFVTAGERGWNLKRVINHRLGQRREDDRLPQILLKPYLEGGSAGYVPPLEEMLRAYYQARGWDVHTGRPSSVRLRALGLENVVKDWLEQEAVAAD
ncbi:MAG: aldehyde ferredoxin oxidoreductase family protein [Chloroflexota bacterium]